MAFRTARYRAVPRHPSKHGANMVGRSARERRVRSVVVAAGVVDAWPIRCGIRDGAEAHGRLQVGQRLCGMERSTSGGPAMYLVWTCPFGGSVMDTQGAHALSWQRLRLRTRRAGRLGLVRPSAERAADVQPEGGGELGWDES